MTYGELADLVGKMSASQRNQQAIAYFSDDSLFVVRGIVQIRDMVGPAAERMQAEAEPIPGWLDYLALVSYDPRS